MCQWLVLIQIQRAWGRFQDLADTKCKIVVSVQMHGNEAIAKLLELPPRRRGRPSLKRS